MKTIIAIVTEDYRDSAWCTDNLSQKDVNDIKEFINAKTNKIHTDRNEWLGCRNSAFKRG